MANAISCRATFEITIAWAAMLKYLATILHLACISPFVSVLSIDFGCRSCSQRLHMETRQP